MDPTVRLRESGTVEGMGIPLAGLAPRGGSRPHANVLKDNGNVHTLTAVSYTHLTPGRGSFPAVCRDYGIRS